MIVLRLLYSAFFYAYMVTMLILTSGALYILSVFQKDKPEFLFFGSRFWCKRLILPVIARIKISGEENLPKKTAVIYVANHQSYFDIPVLLGLLPGSFRFIVNKDYFSMPIIGGFTRRSGHLAINREVGHEAHRTLQGAIDLIKSGKSLIVFPEGTRSPDGRLGRFKRGAFTVAFDTGAPLVPIAISGTLNIMQRRSYLVFPGTINVKIGKPINLKEGKPSKEIYDKTSEFVRGQIQEMLG